jgi:hypothetical protein
MAHNLPKTRGRGADYEPYFPSEWAVASTQRPSAYLAILDCSGSLKKLQPMAVEIFAYSSIVTMATGNMYSLPN